MANVFTDVQNVGAGANLDIQPAAGIDWELDDIGSNVWVGVVPNVIPQVDVGFFDGVLGPAFILRSTDVRGWYRPQKLDLNHANYLRANNPGLAAADISFSVKKIREYGVGISIVKTDLQQLGAGGVYAVQPPAGEDWVINDFGSDQWVGAAPAGLPDLTIDLVEGALTATLLQGTDTRLWEPELGIYVNHADYVQITNSAAVQADIGFSAKLIRSYGVGNSIVRSDVQAILAGGVVDFQPPAGEEWTVNGIGSTAWVGVAPLAFPDIIAGVFDGVNLSTIMDQTGWQKQGHTFNLQISNTNYLRITDTSLAPQNVAISAILTKAYR